MVKFVSFFGEHNPTFDELNQKVKEYAATKGIDFVWVPQKPYNVDTGIAELNNADAGMIDVEPYDEKIFSRMNDRCKLLVRFGVGFDKVNLPDATAHGIACTRTTGANKTGVAEMALMHIMAAKRSVLQNRKIVESGVWTKNIGTEIQGSRVGILGFGNIGIALAKILQGFDCELLAYDTYHNEEAAAQYGVRFTDLDEIFSTCDAISVHLPYTPETHHLIGEKYLGMMKKSAVITCTARGNIVDEDALYTALKGNRIAGAGLDVFAVEPLPTSSKLLELDNIILTPHLSSQTYESLWYTYQKGVDIVADFFTGKDLSRADLLNPDYKNNPRQ